ncbi:hypothetical protein GIB67_010256 [Kingdonia uniflora]|uniref:WD repeat-containing protein 76 n=1 Tax=Kingdonia uniflora TaxID=39325 RepID=A0A7J7NAV4_9MAGN|nr:hypothetical protein GIB67_010256 [Kingdonia uniflora]
MASETLTDYERRRLENIKRNEAVIASLRLHNTANELSSATKRSRIELKTYKTNNQKKPKSETPIVIRRSLRARGIPPDTQSAKGLEDDLVPSPVKTPNPNPPSGPISFRDAYLGDSSDRPLVGTVMEMAENAPLGYSVKRGDAMRSFDLGSLVLKQENIARVIPERTMTVKFLPSNDRTVIVVGDKGGYVAFWDVDCKEEDDGGYLYHPHKGPISGIQIQPFSLSKIYTSCYDGFIRLMDIEKELFDVVYSCNDCIYSLSQRPCEAKSLYFGEGGGLFNVWDERAGKSSNSMRLHEKRINTIDFNPENTNMMVTSSTDGTAYIWDLRNINSKRPKSLITVDHKRAVHSAYFSPSGNYLAITCVDDKVGLLSGVDFSDTSMIYHDNQTGRWISSFRAIWGWDDSHVFIGNMKRGMDVISTDDKLIKTLQSPYITAIPCRFAAHPYQVGTLAGATAGGQVYIWTQR